ncbi:unnamed protein product [Sphagnum balticum]
MLRDKAYKYSPVIVELGRMEGGKVRFLSQGGENCYFGAKSVHVEQDIIKRYPRGDYFLRVRVQWVQPTLYNSAVLVAYGEEAITFRRLQQSEGTLAFK